MRFKEFIWANRSPLYFAGPPYVPDFGSAYALRKKYKREQDWRRSYYLDTILQGAAEDFVASHVGPDGDGAIRCKHCRQPVTGSVLGHLSYACSKFTLDGEDKVRLQGIEDSQHLVGQAAAELPLFPAKWLRGLLQSDVPEPLSMHYNLNISFSSFDVHGLIIAGDGSGGPDSRDYRTRRCGFGVAILHYSANLEQCKMVGHARGTVPGKQTVPRAEAMALLHVLTCTTGYCTYVCDNLGVCNRFWGLSKAGYSSKDNGLLWYHIGLAVERRKASGHGSLEVVWMPSHISFEEAINRGYRAAHWLANQCADKLAGDAAKEAALSSIEVAELRDRDQLGSLILGRLVDVVFHIAPDNVSTGSILSKEHTKPKAELVGLWAREAGHSLDGKNRCVKCGLIINMSKNAEYLRLVLHMECMGGAGLKPHLALHNKPTDRNYLDHNEGQFYLFPRASSP